MVKIIIEFKDNQMGTQISGRASATDIVAITKGFCNAMIISLQNMKISEDDAQCAVAAAALSAAGFTDE